MKKIHLLTLFFLFLQGIRAQSSPPAFIRDSMDAYIQKGLSDWNLPGLAVVIVKDGQIVWMKGYGVRDIMTKKPVDEHTLFMIASNTKLFTGSALAMLETEKKLSLDDPISKFFPDYRLYDSTSTKLVSIRICSHIVSGQRRSKGILHSGTHPSAGKKLCTG